MTRKFLICPRCKQQTEMCHDACENCGQKTKVYNDAHNWDAAAAGVPHYCPKRDTDQECSDCKFMGDTCDGEVDT